MRRILVIVAVVLAVVLAGGGLALASGGPTLRAGGPTRLTGTQATEAFQIGDRTIRQFRYRDRGTLVYRFLVRNSGWMPVTVTGMVAPAHEPRLLHYRALTDAQGHHRFTVPANGATTVLLSFHMTGCEHLSARAGSFATTVALRTDRAGFLGGTTTLALPEQLHTGSPREAFCPNSTATSRPPG